MTIQEEIKSLNNSGVQALKTAINKAWMYVSKSGKQIELNGISSSLLEDILEDNGVDLATSFCDSDGTFVEYNTDYVHFYLDIETGILSITKEIPDNLSVD